MRIGVSSYSYLKYMNASGADYRAICGKAKEAGFDGIEFIDLDLKRQPASSIEALAADIRGYCDDIGLPIFAYTIRADFLAGGEDEIARVQAQADIARILGAKLMRHDATWAKPGSISWQEVVERISIQVRTVSAYAAKLGIRTCTENHGLLMQDSERVEGLIRAVDHENYGWLVDIGNFLCADELPLHALPIAAPYAFHVHAKDFLSKPAEADDPGAGWFRSRHGTFLRGTVAGNGVVPIRKCFDILRENGYSGTMSLEFEGMEDNLPALDAGLAFLRKVT